MADTNQKHATGLHWLTLVVSAALEAVWAVSLSESQGFTVLVPTVIFLVTNVLAIVGLAYAMLGIPVSLAYAIWTGLGAALTVGASFAMGTEDPSLPKLLFLTGIIGCVIALKFAKEPDERPAA